MSATRAMFPREEADVAMAVPYIRAETLINTMSAIPLPLVSDPQRLAALASYAVLDTPAELGFDDIVQLACRLCATPVALVSLVAGDRQWFKARVGFPFCETDLTSSVCAHALAKPDQLLIIPDLTADPRTSDNPLVTGAPRIRFYAGAPLVTPEGQVLGSLCVLDTKPRHGGLTAIQTDDLMRLARQVMTQLEMRHALVARDALHAEERRTFEVREAQRDLQAALALAEGDLGETLRAVVAGAMRAVPTADGGAVELVEGDDLVYRETQGTLAKHRGLRLTLHGTLAEQCVGARSPLRLDDALGASHLRPELIDQLDRRSGVIAPLLRGNTVLGVLKLQASRPNAFNDRDLDQINLFAAAATTALAEADARAATGLRDTYWRSLFDRLHEGFMVGEVVRDDRRRVADWRYVEVNPAWGTLVGLDPAAVIGRTVRDVLPGVEDEWIDEFGKVVETGEPYTFTQQVGLMRRWYEGRAFKLEADQFGVIFLEVTARHQTELRRDALLALGDRLRELTTVPAMTAAAAEIVGRTLGVSRAGFGHIVGDIEYIDIEPDWTEPGVASIAGRHRFDDYGFIREHLRRGEPLIINDVNADPRTRNNPDPMRLIGVGALVNMPVRERGHTVAVFLAHDTAARTWTAEEVAFLRNVADRVEAGVARVRAEDQQTVLNHELAHRLKNTLAVVQTIARQTLRDVEDQDVVDVFERRLLALSRAHDVLLQKSWSAARMRAVMESVLAMQVDLDRFALDGPDLDINPQAALSLSLLLHELATNALKYGSLSASGGTVRITWRTEDEASPTLVLDWTESGGPAVAGPPTGGGFGSKLIRMGLVGTRKADLHYRPVGLKAEFRAPLSHIHVQRY